MEVATIARDGVFSTADARILGLGTRQLQGLARDGACTLLTRGWWAGGSPEDAAGRHRLTATALRRHFANRAWVSHYSALVRRLSVAIVQTGAVTNAMTALCAADAALRRGLVSDRSLAEALTSSSSHPRTSATRALLGHAGGRHESPGETRTAVLLRHLGLVATPQVQISDDGSRYRVDFLLDSAPVVIEFDGRVKYGSGDDVFAEKVREDRLRSWGQEVVRLTWADLSRPDRVATLVAAAVARSRRRVGGRVGRPSSAHHGALCP